MTGKGKSAFWINFAAASFIEDRCLVLAAALSYATVLSLVPSLAVAFSLVAVLGAFGCALVTGVVFGFMPARKAARLDPVTALTWAQSDGFPVLACGSFYLVGEAKMLAQQGKLIPIR